MKRLTILFSVLFTSSLLFVACSEEKANLQWTNKSAAEINEIVWSGDDTQWSQDGGYVVDADTESKEVTGLTGNVNCAINDGVGFVAADVIIEGENDNTLSLNDGDNKKYNITAAAKR